MRNNRLVLIPLIATLLFVTGCGKKESEKPVRLTRVLVTGDSDQKAQPDTAVVVLSVVTQNQRAVGAQQENARKTAAVIQAVRETAGDAPEIQTSDYSLQPQRSYRYNSLPSIIGYEARNSVTVRLGNLDNVGAVIDAASRAGANSVDGVSFVVREDNPIRNRTLAEATREAMGKAQAMAEAAGGRVVRVVEEREEGFVNYPPATEEAEWRYDYENSPHLNASASAKASPRTPVEAGPLNVRTRVQLIVEVEAPAQTALP